MKSIIFLIIISCTFLSAETYSVSSSNKKHTTLKIQAFEVLKTKCNICHQEKNKKKIFTLENMDGYGKKIYKQVFKWKRMPKGTEIKLTTDEYSQLKNWLSSLNIGQ